MERTNCRRSSAGGSEGEVAVKAAVLALLWEVHLCWNLLQ